MSRATRILYCCLLIIISSVFASGCSDNSGTASGSADVKDSDIQIITSFYPVYLTTINITRDIQDVTVTNMTEPQTGCLHDYSLKTGDMKKLEDGDIFIINGAGMEAFLEKVTSQMPDLDIVDASEGMELLKDEASGEDNPHVWVSVTGAIEQTQNIAVKLAALDPDNAEKYSLNAEEYVRKLEALRNKMHSELDGLGNRDIVTFHEAFPYFAKEFDLNIKAVLVQEEGNGPDAGQLARTVDIVKDEGIRALFTEPQYQHDIADTVARETGAKIYSLDPIVTGEADGDFDAYIRKMEANMLVLKEALAN